MLIWLIAFLIDGLIVILCYLIGRETMKNKTETKRVLLRSLLVPEQKKEIKTDQSMLLVSIICAGILLIPLSFISWLTAGWLLLIGVIFAGIYNLVLTGTNFIRSKKWFEKFVSKYLDAEPDATENMTLGFSETFIVLLKKIEAADASDKAIVPEAEGKVTIAGMSQAGVVMKMLETNTLAIVKGDTAYFNKQFFNILSEFAVGMHRELEPIVAELVRLTLLQTDEE